MKTWDEMNSIEKIIVITMMPAIIPTFIIMCVLELSGVRAFKFMLKTLPDYLTK